ncbi:hypothetical protein [Fictibacillus macauensis]|uniref:hypothetical protein n=1 Tax=Fictibacillus macauensis TaxID=245160 RepID=UPI00031C23E6|nr:hypothetical protein [Fictibacillus macauensis]
MTNDKDCEGRKEFYVDIDRMINEGMGGGSIANEHDLKQITYSPEVGPEEEPPIKQE